MKVNLVETKADENVVASEEIIKQLLVLALVTLSLVIIAFLFAGCSGSSGSDATTITLKKGSMLFKVSMCNSPSYYI